MTTWRESILSEMEARGESWADVVACTLSDAELDARFDDGYGVSEGRPFTLWTIGRVYFPVVYDGAEWVGSAPRKPCGEACRHFGGE